MRKRSARAVVRADWQRGLSVTEIHRKRGLSRGYIYTLTADLREPGERRISGSPATLREKRDKGFVAGWNLGRTAESMADEAGVSIPIVYKVLRIARTEGKLTRPLMSQKVVARFRNTAIVNDWNQGYSRSQLVRKYRLSRGRVDLLIARARRVYGDRIRSTKRMRTMEAKRRRVEG